MSQKIQKVIRKDGVWIPVRYPYLNDCGGDLSKRWVIEYGVFNQNLNKGKGGLQRKQHKLPLRMTDKERRAYATKYIYELKYYLSRGYHVHKNEKNLITQAEEDRRNSSLAEAIDEILKVKSALIKETSFKTYKAYGLQFRDWIEEQYPDILLKEVTTQLGIQFLDDIQVERGLSNRSRNNKLTILRTMFNDLKKRGYMNENPLDGITKERTKEPQNYPFRQFHKDLLIPVLQKDDPQLWQACQFLYYLFIRPSELIGLKVNQIRWDQNQVVIPNTYKSGRAKYPTISESFQEVLNGMNLKNLNPDWYVFGKGGEPGPSGYAIRIFTSRFKKILRKLHIDGPYNFYCWKHTGNLDALLNGVNIKAIQKQNGHADIQDTDRYLRSLGVEHNEQIRSLQPSLTKK